MKKICLFMKNKTLIFNNSLNNNFSYENFKKKKKKFMKFIKFVIYQI